MAQATAAFSAAPSARGERVSLSRLLWVAPLTVVFALAVNYALKTVLLAFVPALARMGQLREPMIVLTLVGSILAVVVFAAMALAVRRPIFWYRRVALAALAVSVLPDLGLLMGGAYALMGMRAVGPFLSLMSLVAAPARPPPGAGGGPRPGGPPAGGFPGLALEQVLVLMLLHVATAVVCILMLTTLTRQPESSEA